VRQAKQEQYETNILPCRAGVGRCFRLWRRQQQQRQHNSTATNHRYHHSVESDNTSWDISTVHRISVRAVIRGEMDGLGGNNRSIRKLHGSFDCSGWRDCKNNGNHKNHPSGFRVCHRDDHDSASHPDYHTIGRHREGGFLSDLHCCDPRNYECQRHLVSNRLPWRRDFSRLYQWRNF
jgi:hypothetical protein